MFTGSRGTGNLDGTPGNWNGMIGQFTEIRSTDDPVTGKGFQFFDYGSTATMAQKTDLTVAGALQDCNECHVGGGAMEYLPSGGKNFASALQALGNRTSLREITTGTPNNGDPITAAKFTTFNYFLDSNDVDQDSNYGEMLYNDYAKTGVGEMDCLMCHLEGYNWDTRKVEIKKAKHDEARAVGAGIATANTLVAANTTTPDFMPDNYGTTVGAYDMYHATTNSTGEVTTNTSNQLVLTAAFANNIKKTPPSANCASCHFGDGFTVAAGGDSKVDVKKRGDHWLANHNWDVHSGLDCMDCHNNSTTFADTVAATPGPNAAGTTGAMKPVNAVTDPDANNDGLTDTNSYKVDQTGPDSGKLGMCDPGHKSGNFVGVWNSKDANVDGTACTSCHGGTTAVPVGPRAAQYPLAPNPTAAHTAAGLMAVNMQDGYDIVARPHTPGTANTHHIDVISCSACHIRKLEHYAGGAYLDSTGRDALGGHLVDHENSNTLRDMFDSSIPVWYKGKLRKASVVTTLLWVDNNAATIDANQDGLEGALDVIMPSQTARLNTANGRNIGTHDAGSLTATTGGNVLPSDINIRQGDIYAGLAGLIGETEAIWPQLNFMHAAFVMDHGVSPASTAWGIKGCKDCHAPLTVVNGVRTAGGFYNGAYSMKASQGTFSFNSGFVNGYGYPAAAGQFGAGTNCVWPTTDPNCYGNQPSYMQVAPFYMVNNMTENTNFHPYLYERGTKTNDTGKALRSLSVDTTSTYAAYGATQVRDVDRSEMLYENSFKKLKVNPWSTGGGTLTGAPIYVPNATQGDSNRGYMLTVLVKNNGDADSTAVRRTLMKPANNAAGETVAQLINQFSMMFLPPGGPYCNGIVPCQTPYGFSLVDAGGGALTLDADTGKQIRVQETMSRFGFGFAGYYVTPAGVQYSAANDHIYDPAPITAVTGATYADRLTWVNYLNSIATAPTATITLPVAAPPAIEPAVKNIVETFTAATTGHHPGTRYTWTMGNGVSCTGVGTTGYTCDGPNALTDDYTIDPPNSAANMGYTYRATGLFTVRLIVAAPYGGNQTTDFVKVNVAASVPVDFGIVLDQHGSNNGGIDTLQLTGMPVATTKIFVAWGDSAPGTTKATAAGADTNIDHTYNKRAKYRSTISGVDAYRYNTDVRLYSATGALLATKRYAVTINP